jgi:hypothetical protein
MQKVVESFLDGLTLVLAIWIHRDNIYGVFEGVFARCWIPRVRVQHMYSAIFTTTFPPLYMTPLPSPFPHARARKRQQKQCWGVWSVHALCLHTDEQEQLPHLRDGAAFDALEVFAAHCTTLSREVFISTAPFLYCFVHSCTLTFCRQAMLASGTFQSSHKASKRSLSAPDAPLTPSSYNRSQTSCSKPGERLKILDR